MATGQLMFEVGIKSAQEQLDKIKQEFTKANGDLQKLLNLKVSIDGVDAVTKALNQIGDTAALRNLKNEIAALNREFSILSKGAGGSGDIAGRGLAADIERTSQSIDRYTSKIKQLTEERGRLIGGTRNSSYQNYTDEILRYEQSLEGARKKLAQLNEQKNQSVASEPLKKATQDAKTFETALGRIETAIGGLKSGMSVNLTGDFSKWAQEVQSVTASVRELVEQLQKMHNASTTALQATQQLSQAENKPTSNGSIFDPQKFTTLQESIDKIISEINRLQQAFTKLGENSSLSNLSTMINGLAVTLSSLSNAIKIQPLDEQVKALLERCEKAEAKLREVGDAAKYLNERAGAKTQQKAGTIMDITGTEAEQLNKVSSTAKRFARLLVEIENQMAKIGKIQAFGEQSGFSPTLLKNAQNQLEALHKMVESTFKGTPLAEGLIIPASDSQLAQFIQQFGLLKAQYRDIITEADKFNKANEKDSLRQKSEELKTAAANMKAAENESRRLTETISNLEALASKAGALGIDTSKLRNVIDNLKGLRILMDDVAKTNSRSTKDLKLEERFFQLKRDIKDVARDIKKEMSAALKPDTEQANAFKEYASVLRQISSLVKTIHAADKLGIDSTQLRGMTDQLVVYAQTLERIARAGGVGFTSWRQSNEGISYLGLRTDASNKQALLNAEVADAKRTNTLATNQLTTSEQQLSNAIKGSTDSMRGQSQVLSDLKMLATQYLSVWGAQSFMNSIIETGGQLEQQRLSLSAILGDMEKANTLFGQVKQLALKSPFGVVQIDQMTKQLAAYSFEYEELFDWTKRLADISAATGTSVDRLALALGHVRSEGALSGYTLRQFAMANVPVLRMLSENLGISSKEVRERVRKKEIGADDVQEILKQLTDEGGMFYNAQEVMSQALNAKFKNLRDAFDIMYGEIAEGGVGNALKELANILTQGAKEWERYGKDMLAVGAAVGIGRAAMVLYNTALGENTASTLKSIAAAQQKENANLRLARAAGIVTKAEYEQLIYNERYSVSGLKVALVENKLTIEELQRAVALGKVNKAVAQAAVVAAGYDAALISNVKVLGFWRRGLFLLGEGFRAATVAVKGFLASVWPLLALTAVFDLVNKTSQSNDAAVEAAEGAAKATNKYQDLQAMTERLGTSQNKTTDQLENNIKAMKEGLIAVGKYTDELKKQVESVETLAEKYDILHAAMKKVSDEANDKQSRKQNLIEEGLSAGGGTAWNPLNWFRDNALQDAKDIDDYTEKLYLALDKNDRVLRDGFRKILETKKLWQKKFESMSAKDVFMSLDESVQNDVLYALRWGNNSTKEMQSAGRSLASVLYGSGGKELKDAIGYSYKGAIEELRGHKDELAKAFADAFQVDHPEIDLSKADKDQKIIFAKWLDTTIANLNDVKDAGKKALNDIVIEGTISVRPVYSLDNENWSKFIEDFKEKNPLAYYEWNKHESTGALTEEEKRKSLESYGKTFSGVTQNTLGNAAKKQIKELQEERKRLVDFEKSIVYNDSEEARQNTEKRKKEIDEQINRLKQAQKDYNQYGDPDKNKGRGEDKEAKELRERVRILKEAESSYQYWRKAVGEAASAFHVNDEFGKILFEQGFSFTDVEKYTKTLEELRSKYQAIYDTSEKAGKKRPQLLEAIKEIDKVLADIGRKDFERDTKKYVSQLTLEIEELTRKWEIFNSVRNETGDSALAQRLTGITPGATPADLKRYNVASFAGVDIDFDSVLQMSDEQIDRYVEKLGVPEEKIEAIRNGLKDWKKAQKDIITSDIQNYAKWLGSLVDLQSIQTRNQNEYNQTLEETNRLLKEGKITQEEADRRKKSAAVTFDTKNWQTTKMYSDLYNNAIMMANSEFSQAYEREMKSLNDQMKAGTLSAKDYADKVANLNEIAKEFSIDGFLGLKGGIGAFLSGGNDALIQYYNKRAKKARMAQAFYQQANDKKNAEKSDEEAKKYENLSVQLVKISDGAKKVYSAFQTLSSGIDLVADLFANMGYGDTAEAIGDVGSVFGSALSGASSLSMLGPYGMAAGAAIGLVSGIFALQDKQIQREIDALKDNVAALEENTRSIKDYRKRTLGYDDGNLRKSIADKYITTIVDAYKEAVAQGHHFIPIMDPSQFAMARYYATNSGMSGYQAEFENLKAQREDYRKMYNLERSKKNVSEEALNEYTKQIAELDEQIFYFTEDLANELWGIDFKAWASQISDALWTAFENGESALEAFHDTAKDIISDVAKRMMNIHLIEPVFSKLEERLFGKIDENGVRTGGVYNETTGQFDENETLRILGEFFGEDGEFAKVVESAEDFYKMVERVTGFDLSDDGGSSSSSKTIKGITEQTADLLASYVSAIRLDVSVIRTLDAKVLQEYWPSQIRLMTSGTQSLTNIEQHTLAIMRSNDVIAERITNLDNNINGLKSKTWSIPVS